jgi:hypothetical protein
VAAASYALSEREITTILEYQDPGEKRIYYHNFLTTNRRPITSLLHNNVRNYFRQFFLSPRNNAEYRLDLGLEGTESLFDQ